MLFSEYLKMRNYTCWFHSLFNSEGDGHNWRGFGGLSAAGPAQVLKPPWETSRLAGNLVVSFPVTPDPASCKDSSQSKTKNKNKKTKTHIFHSRQGCGLFFCCLRNLRLFREKRVGKKCCKETAAVVGLLDRACMFLEPGKEGGKGTPHLFGVYCVLGTCHPWMC